jgi:hypothetical protein
LIANGKNFDAGFPTLPPLSSTQPHPFTSHDVSEADWSRSVAFERCFIFYDTEEKTDFLAICKGQQHFRLLVNKPMRVVSVYLPVSWEVCSLAASSSVKFNLIHHFLIRQESIQRKASDDEGQHQICN